MLLEPLIEPVDQSASKGVCASVTAHSPTQRILLVDDDAKLRELYARVLTGSGYQVDTAPDGEAGWLTIYAQSSSDHAYDLIITDNNMPKLTGVGLVKMVRSAGMTLPIILASGNPPDEADSLQLSALLPKPFSAEELIQTVKETLYFSTYQQ